MHPALVDATRAFAGAYLVAMMAAMGLALGGEPAEDAEGKRRRRRLLVRALVFELVVLPLGAVALTRALDTSGDVAIAFLLLAASPGGGFAPQLARLARADLGLSVEIALFCAKLVSFTAPVAAGRMLHLHHIELHELDFIARLLLLQLLPYLAGRRVRARRPDLAARLAGPLEWAMWASLLGVLGSALADRDLRGLGALVLDRGWWAVVAFALAAPALGWLVGGPARATRQAFAISAGARDLGIAIVMASLAFPDRLVHVATIAVWLALSVVDLGWAWLAGARPREPMRGTPART